MGFFVPEPVYDNSGKLCLMVNQSLIKLNLIKEFRFQVFYFYIGCKSYIMKTSFLLIAILSSFIATAQAPKTKAEAVKILQQYIHLGNKPDDFVSISTVEYLADKEVLIYERKAPKAKTIDRIEIPLKSVRLSSIKKSNTMMFEHKYMDFECISGDCFLTEVIKRKGKKNDVQYSYSSHTQTLRIPESVVMDNPGAMQKMLEAFKVLVKLAQGS